MTRSLRSAAVAAVVLSLILLHNAPAFAQATTVGRIVGLVADESGAVMPGVTVTATSPALQVPQVVVVTDDKGEYRLTELPIGAYSVKYELQGFQAVVRGDIRITAGFIAKIDVALKLGALTESITVSGEAPVVDVTSTSTATQFTREALESLPTSRNSVMTLLAEAPGARTTGGLMDVGGSQFTTRPSFNAFGRRGQAWLMTDGVLSTSPGSGTQGVYLDYSTIEEAQVQTLGTDASMPVSGVFLNAIIKSGGNNFHGNGFFSNTSPKTQADNIDSTLQAQGVTAGNPLVARWDLSAELGGRIVKDKIWFFGNARRSLNEQAAIGGNDGTNNNNVTKQAFWTAKVSYQVNPKHKLIGLYQWNKKYIEFGATAFIPYASQPVQNQDGFVAKGEWNGQFGTNIIASVVGSHWVWLNAARGHAYGQVATFDQITQQYTGDSISQWIVPRNGHEYRNSANGKLAWFKSDLFHGDHEFKMGFDYTQGITNEFLDPRGDSGDYSLVFRSGVPFQVITYNSPVNPFTNANYTGVYVSDSWTLTRGLTLDIGTRVDRWDAFIPAQSRIAGTFASAQDFAAVQFPVWTDIAPRIHFSWDPSGTGRTAIKGGWGHFNEARNTGEIIAANQNAATRTTYTWHDLNNDKKYQTGEVNLSLTGNDFVSTTTLGTLQPNPNEQEPKLDEFSLSLERQLVTDLAVRATVLYARRSNNRALLAPGRPWEAYSNAITRPDPGPDGRVGTADDPGRNLTYYEYPAALRPIQFQVQQAINIPGTNDWKSFEIAATKRMSRNWMLSASFSATKNHVIVTSTNGEGGYQQSDTKGWDPNSQLYAQDDTWQWNGKINGSYRFPWELLASFNFQAVSGEPYARTVSLTGGSTITSITLPVEEVGARRYPSVKLVDLRLQKTIKLAAVGSSHNLAIRVDLFNLFNSNTVTGLTTLSGANFERPTAILPPRIVAFGFTYNF